MTKTEDILDRKGMWTKLFSVLVVSLFIASAFCAMIAMPVESETAIQTTSEPDFEEMERSIFTDNPMPAVKKAADFTVDAEAALAILNDCKLTSHLCTWDAKTKTLNLAPVEYTLLYQKEENDIGAAIVLPAGSTVNLLGPCKIAIDVADSQTLSHQFGLYCYGDLEFNTYYNTIEFVLANLDKRKISQEDLVSAGLYVKGKLTVNGEKTGRLAVRSGFNNVTPTIAIYAEKEMEVNNSEIMASANIGINLREGQFIDYCTVGIYSPKITIDCMDCQKVWAKGGLNDNAINDSKSCGIVTNTLDVKHGNVVAKGGDHFEVNKSIGIEFIGENASLTGKGTVNANGGNAGKESMGILANELYIDIPKLNATGAFSGFNIHGIYGGSVEMRDTDLNIMIGDVSELDIIRGMTCDAFVAHDSNITITVEGCNATWGFLIKESSFTGCKINIEIKNSPYNYVVDGNGMCGDQMEFKDCDVNLKVGDSRFNENGINVSAGPEGKGWVIIDHSRVHVEMGNDVGVDSVFITGIQAYNLMVKDSELYVKSGNSDSDTCGIRMNGGVAIIENSRVTSYGGDIIDDNASNAYAITCGFATRGPLTMKDSEVCFYGGENHTDDGKSAGLCLLSKENEQVVKIKNCKFDSKGQISAMYLEDKDLCKFECPELYGKNKETGQYEKFDIRDIDKYSEIATSNWIEEKEKTDSQAAVWIVLALAIIAVMSTLIFVIVKSRRD